MSYILNALKHSESQRNRGEIPHIDSQPEFGKVASRKWSEALWKWLALAALVALLLSLAWMLFDSVPNALQETPAASAPAVEPAAKPQDAMPLALPESSAQAPGLPALQGMAGVRVRLDDDVATSPEVAFASDGRESPRVVLDMPISLGVAAPPAPVPTAAREAPPVVREALPVRDEAPPEEAISGVNHWKTLPAQMQKQLREMAFTAHIYSSDPAARFIRVSGRTLREGDLLSAQLKLQQIARDGIVFSYGRDKFWFGFN